MESGFSIVPAQVLNALQEGLIGDSALRLAVVLGKYMNNKTQVCWPSCATLIEESRIKDWRTFTRAREELGKIFLTWRKERDTKGHNQVFWKWGTQPVMVTGRESETQPVMVTGAVPVMVTGDIKELPIEHPKKKHTSANGAEREQQQLTFIFFALINHYADSFERFWDLYPRKVAKIKAREAWLKLLPDGDLAGRIFEAVKKQSLTAQWQENGGRYIPHPTTWLNQERWTDEPVGKLKKQKNENLILGI